MAKRTIFFISDGTGLTAASLGQSLLTQFDISEFAQIAIPHVDSLAKLTTVCERINATAARDHGRPIVFSTLIDNQLAQELAKVNGLVINVFQAFMGQLENELHMSATHRIGVTHGVKDDQQYQARMEAINFTLTTDDGANTHHYQEAEVILLGVSRCGKTPTSIYLALQFALYTANYPFTEEDFPLYQLPEKLQTQRKKLFGLTIDPLRLQAIRSKRKPDSRYASLAQCEYEIREVENLFKRESIPYLNSTTRSIEEIAVAILNWQKNGVL